MWKVSHSIQWWYHDFSITKIPVHAHAADQLKSTIVNQQGFLSITNFVSLLLSFKLSRKEAMKQKNYWQELWPDDYSTFLIAAVLKNKKLSVRGVFGSSCRHQFPLKFCDMAHGERCMLACSVMFFASLLHALHFSFAYPRYMLARLKQDLPPNQFVLLYDIGCKFSKHLLKWAPDLHENVHIRVPVMHSYAHNLQCQVLFHNCIVFFEICAKERF